MPSDLTGFGPAAWPTLAEAVTQIRARNAELHALRLDLSTQAQSRQARVAGGALARVPYSLKDVWDSAEHATTAGSLQYRERHAQVNCSVLRALDQAGALCVGRSNVSDLAATPECANLIVGASRNPHDTQRSPGGSSGGAAAAVASGMAAFDWGSDFGGSIRLPAAFCGIAGLRLTSSTWPVTGHFPFIRPQLGLQGQGPLARGMAGIRQVRDALAPALRISGGAGFALRGVVVLDVDSFSVGEWPYASSEISDALGGAQLRQKKAALPAPLDIHHAFSALLANHWWQIFGAHLRPCSLAPWSPQRLHPHTQRIITELALANLSVYRDRAHTKKVVTEIRRLCNDAFTRGLVIACPTTTHPAPLLNGAHAIRDLGVFVKLGNLLDATALAVPFGRFASGLPRSLQLIGPAAAEDCLLDLGEALTRAN